MSAARLRAVAADMRAKAEAVDTSAAVTETGLEFSWSEQIAFCVSKPDSDHLTAWHPAVALAVADWLEALAWLHEHGDSGGPRTLSHALAVCDAWEAGR